MKQVKVFVEHYLEVVSHTDWEGDTMYGVAGEIVFKSRSYTTLNQAIHRFKKAVFINNTKYSEYGKRNKDYYYILHFESWSLSSEKEAIEYVEYVKDVLQKIVSETYQNEDKENLKEKVLRELVYYMFELIEANEDFNLVEFELEENEETVSFITRTDQYNIIETLEILAKLSNAKEFNITERHERDYDQYFYLVVIDFDKSSFTNYLKSRLSVYNDAYSDYRRNK